MKGFSRVFSSSGFPRLLPLCLGLMAVVFLAYPAASLAHAPSDVTLTYDSQAASLSAKITHKTPSSFHYIKKVVVKKNGNVVDTYEYSSQPDKNEFTYTYKLEAAPGDTIEVTANCNIYGSKTVTLTVPK